MATPTATTLIARGNRFRVHSLAAGGWRIGFITRLGYRDFLLGDPATDAAFSEFASMSTADQIDAAGGDPWRATNDAAPRARHRLDLTGGGAHSDEVGRRPSPTTPHRPAGSPLPRPALLGLTMGLGLAEIYPKG